VLFALSTGHKIGLLVAAAILIAFSLAASFYFPRADPDFPGRRGLKPFVLLTMALVAGMLLAVEFFGKETKEAAAERPATTAPATTQANTGTTKTNTGTTPQPAPVPAGNAAAGKAVFAGNGCGACHTFQPAGSTGKIGPDLGNLAAGAQEAGQPLAEYARQSIVDPNAFVVKGYPSGVMPGDFGQKLSKTQLDDLVAFLVSGQK
jgi:cytochrome c551/c552